MATWVAPCGCRVSRSMFGAREILSVSPCLPHALQLQAPLSALNDALCALIGMPVAVE